MRVYRFLNKEYGLKSIKEKRLRISRIMELNDPFEFLPYDMSDPKFRDGMLRYKKNMSEAHGLICFSRKWSSPSLWAHYADKHKGICLGFEIQDPRTVKKVEYIRRRLPAPKEITPEFARSTLFKKFHHWKYEQEYRAYTSLENKTDGNFYTGFSENLKLKEVIIGCESDITHLDIQHSVGDSIDGVVVVRAYPSHRDFKVVQQTLKTE